MQRTMDGNLWKANIPCTGLFDGSEVPLNGSQRIDESIFTSQDEDEDPMYNEASDESDCDD